MKTRHNKWNNKRTARPIVSCPEKFSTIHQGFEALRSIAGPRSATIDYRTNDLISIPRYLLFKQYTEPTRLSIVGLSKSSRCSSTTRGKAIQAPHIARSFSSRSSPRLVLLTLCIAKHEYFALTRRSHSRDRLFTTIAIGNSSPGLDECSSMPLLCAFRARSGRDAERESLTATRRRVSNLAQFYWRSGLVGRRPPHAAELRKYSTCRAPKCARLPASAENPFHRFVTFCFNRQLVYVLHVSSDRRETRLGSVKSRELLQILYTFTSSRARKRGSLYVRSVRDRVSYTSSLAHCFDDRRESRFFPFLFFLSNSPSSTAAASSAVAALFAQPRSIISCRHNVDACRSRPSSKGL
ncbi:unnamed protein product [Trichogramma brassicae]|uniref:Uncharacterized protein n=1 Tax=Trichogramma brassicae TaxID=86971 RepID=A0A6H5IZY1_9HYME|nr:unnamed protein product [Trichogramma brassicae]